MYIQVVVAENLKYVPASDQGLAGEYETSNCLQENFHLKWNISDILHLFKLIDMGKFIA